MPTMTAEGADPISSRFSHEREEAEPGYYKVYLPDHKIQVELTATARGGLHRYLFDATLPLDVVVDLVHGIEDSPTDGMVSVLNDSTLAGHRFSTGWARTQRFYFVLQFSRPFATWRATVNGAPAVPLREVRGTNVRGVVTFAKGSGQLLARVGISPVSIEGALRNLQAEIPEWNFDRVRRGALDAWEAELRKFTIRSKNEEGKKVFYTAVYHTLLAPVLFNDVDGSYRGGDSKVHPSPGHDTYHIFSLWDTFRTLHPLFTITQPRRVEDMVRSMLRFSDEHGLLPVWRSWK
jgi:predicted alpha-1,2-mannosidase